jgi:NTP pyrophosphatase (non-canonical NTP hydrolase)
MDLKQYTQDAIRTESRITEARVDPVLFRQVLCIFIAAGSMLDQLKKNMYYGKPVKTEMWEQHVRAIRDHINHLSTGVYLPLTQQQPLDIDTRVLHAVIGIATESTELVEAIYHRVNSGLEIDRVNLLEELGDVNWYQAILVDALSGDWEKILDTNIAKLRARYPEKFTSEAAIDRDIDTERTILEGGADVERN